MTNLTTPTLSNTTATVNAASSGSDDNSGSGFGLKKLFNLLYSTIIEK